jgi:hypothetical protein
MKVGISLLTVGIIALAGNMFLAAKWPMVLSIFFTCIKIYTAFSLFINHFIS